MRDVPADVAMLEIEGLSVSYGQRRALEGVSLRVREGEIVTLLGANGSGQSTELRAISGLVRPQRRDRAAGRAECPPGAGAGRARLRAGDGPCRGGRTECRAGRRPPNPRRLPRRRTWSLRGPFVYDRGKEGQAVNENYDSYSDKEAVERKFRMAMANEARAERELREKIQKWFYVGVGALVVFFIVAMLFF